MYQDVITIYNFFEDKKQDIAGWYPTTLSGVEVQISKGLNVSKTGNENANSLYVSIPLICSNNELFADGIKYIKPKSFKALSVKSDTFTLSENDFIAVGNYKEIHNDFINDYDYEEGFLQYMKSTYDDVFEVKTVDTFKTIRHIEVGGN